jgi:ribosomal protein L32
MGLGSVLVGIGLAIVAVAYVALPFRKTRDDPGKVIEAWVGQVRARGVTPQGTGESLQSTEGRKRRRQRARPGAEAALQAGAVNFCPQCGRRVGPDDRFCAGCGRQLRESDE